MVLHMMAVVQLRTPTTEGRTYYNRKVADGKSPNEAMRCLKRRLPTSSTGQCSTTASLPQRQAREDTGERH